MNGLHREWQAPSLMSDQTPYPLMDSGYSLPSHRDLSPSERPDLTSSSSSRVLSQPGTPQPSGKDSYSASPPTRHAPYPSWLASHKKKRSQSDASPLEPTPDPVHNSPIFTTKECYGNLYALDQSTVFEPRVDAKIDRGFFLADSDWTCYRRNYFQISATFAIDGLGSYNEHEIPCLIDVGGRLQRVQQFMLGISSHMYNSRDKTIDLIQHTAKRDRGPRNTPPLVPITAGGDLRLSSIGSTQAIATFERVQFKTATANNGRRRAAQQYHILCVEVYAQTEAGQQVRICVAESERLVVRGRSPGHYNDHNVRYSTQYSRKQSGDSVNQDYPSPYPKPPIMSPTAVTPTAEYGPTSYPSYGYPAFNNMGSPYHQQNGPAYHPVVVNGGPPSQPLGIPSISDPSSSESSSPDLNNAEFADNRNGQVYHQHQPPSPYEQVVRPVPSNAPYYGREGDDPNADWHRSRAASGSSMSTDHTAYSYPAYNHHPHYVPHNDQYDLRAGQSSHIQEYSPRDPPPMRWQASQPLSQGDYVDEPDHYRARTMAPPYSYESAKEKSDAAASQSPRGKDVPDFDEKNTSERQEMS